MRRPRRGSLVRPHPSPLPGGAGASFRRNAARFLIGARRAVVCLVGLAIGWLCMSSALGAEPAVQMLVPGFDVKALPVRLTNINSLAFAPDGQLFAAAYNGKVYRLVDSNGDGLEDRAEPF